MLRLIQRMFAPSANQPGKAGGRARLTADEWPAVVYAIGDVHGCRAELDMLEAMIVSDSADVEGEKWLVMLGDYVDRGPRSADVLDRLCSSPPAGFRRICIAGNHEVMMLAFLAAPTTDSDWLRFGGIETLASYHIDMPAFRRASMSRRKQILQSHIPAEHIEFLEGLPLSLTLPETVFVHAGIRPDLPLEAQSESDMLWIREPFLSNLAPLPYIVVHGHTPTAEPQLFGSRIGIDTGAFATGILTALRLTQDGSAAFLDTRPSTMR